MYMCVVIGQNRRSFFLIHIFFASLVSLCLNSFAPLLLGNSYSTIYFIYDMRLSVVGVKIEENKYPSKPTSQSRDLFHRCRRRQALEWGAHRALLSEVEMKTNSKPEHQTTFINNIFFMLQVFFFFFDFCHLHRVLSIYIYFFRACFVDQQVTMTINKFRAILGSLRACRMQFDTKCWLCWGLMNWISAHRTSLGRSADKRELKWK